MRLSRGALGKQTPEPARIFPCTYEVGAGSRSRAGVPVPRLRNTHRAVSSENVELVRAVVPNEVDLAELFAGNDLSALPIDPSLVDPELEVAFLPASIESQGRYQGLTGLAAGWLDWLEPWESYHLEMEEFIDAGEHVIVLARVKARTRRDGVVVEHKPASIWTVGDGRIVALRFYLDRAEAFEAVGLDPAQARSRG
jgi:ketosteroid isomerase-like protein